VPHSEFDRAASAAQRLVIVEGVGAAAGQVHDVVGDQVAAIPLTFIAAALTDPLVAAEAGDA
jgi:hypothetical protein